MNSFIAIVILNTISYFLLERKGYEIFLSYYAAWYLGVLVAELEANSIGSSFLNAARHRTAAYTLSFIVTLIGCVVFFHSQYISFQIWASAFAIFLVSTLNHPQEFKGATVRMFRWLGTFSFSIYIIHLPLIVMFHSALFNSERQVSVLPFFAETAAALACAYLFSLVFERPALALSQALRSKLSPPKTVLDQAG